MNSAEIIKTCRERAGLTRQQLADKCGLSYNHIWLWETGQVGPKVDNFLAVLNAAGFEIIIKEKETAYYKTDPTRRKKVYR